MHRFFAYTYSVLGILCVSRTLITTVPDLNIDLHPKFLEEYLHIKLIDVVVLLIWALVSFVCGKSILGQYGVLKIGSFRQLFHNAFFDSTDPTMNCIKSALVLILTALSINYVARMVYFIYDQWSIELSPLLQALQLYPALLMAFQSLYQGSYLLKCLVYSPDKDSFDKHHQMQKQQLQDHIWLNFTFILHSFCIFIVIRLCSIEPQILWEMVTGEVAYRLFAVFMFWKLLKKLNEFGAADGNQAVYNQGEEVQPVEAITEDTGELVMHTFVTPIGNAARLKNEQEQGHFVQPVETSESKAMPHKSEIVIATASTVVF